MAFKLRCSDDEKGRTEIENLSFGTLLLVDADIIVACEKGLAQSSCGSYQVSPWLAELPSPTPLLCQIPIRPMEKECKVQLW